MAPVAFEHVVVVCGMPGAGKTWLSEQLSPKVGYPLLSRDRILASLYDALPVPEELPPSEWSLAIGTAAFSVFLDLARWLGPRLGPRHRSNQSGPSKLSQEPSLTPLCQADVRHLL